MAVELSEMEQRELKYLQRAEAPMTPQEALTKAGVPECYWHRPKYVRPSYQATIYRSPWEIGIRVARKAISYGQILEQDEFLLKRLKRAIFLAVRDQVEEAART